jgi:dienelactone hydrolase
MLRALAAVLVLAASTAPALAQESGRCRSTRLDLAGVADEDFRRDLAAFDGPVDAPPDFGWSARDDRTASGWPVMDVIFPSPIRSPYPENDTVYCRYYVPAGRPGTRVPAAIVLHHLGGDFVAEAILAEYLARCGVAAIEVEFPYYGPRRPKEEGKKRGRSDAVLSDLDLFVAATRQAVADVRRAADWLAARPEVDPERLGCVGVSLGGILGSIVAGVDPRFRRNVLVIAGGDLPSIILHGSRETRRVIELLREKGIDRPRLESLLWPIEPTRVAPRIAPGTTLMLNASRDEVIPRESTDALWQAAGRPEIAWYDTGHATIAFYLLDLFAKTRDHFLRRAAAGAAGAGGGGAARGVF